MASDRALACPGLPHVHRVLACAENTPREGPGQELELVEGGRGEEGRTRRLCARPDLGTRLLCSEGSPGVGQLMEGRAEGAAHTLFPPPPFPLTWIVFSSFTLLS